MPRLPAPPSPPPLPYNHYKIPPPFPPPQLLVPHMVDEYRQAYLLSLPPLTSRSSNTTSSSSSSSPSSSSSSPPSSPLSIIGYASVFIGCMVFIVYYAKNIKLFLGTIKDMHLLGNLVSFPNSQYTLLHILFILWLFDTIDIYYLLHSSRTTLCPGELLCTPLSCCRILVRILSGYCNIHDWIGLIGSCWVLGHSAIL